MSLSNAGFASRREGWTIIEESDEDQLQASAQVRPALRQISRSLMWPRQTRGQERSSAAPVHCSRRGPHVLTCRLIEGRRPRLREYNLSKFWRPIAFDNAGHFNPARVLSVEKACSMLTIRCIFQGIDQPPPHNQLHRSCRRSALLCTS